MLKSSIGRKFLMAISGIFLIIFLTQHLIINITSVFPDQGKTFNELSHFMGTNLVVQFILQPILILGVVFHFVLGIYLEIKNRQTRRVEYFRYDQKTSSSWVSRNMIITGLVILGFLGLHFYDFWIPELKDKFIDGIWDDTTKYFPHLQHKFQDQLGRVVIYCASFILLGLHLSHGLTSSLQSMGATHVAIKLIARLYSLIVPLGFALIALYHYFF